MGNFIQLQSTYYSYYFVLLIYEESHLKGKGTFIICLWLDKHTLTQTVAVSCLIFACLCVHLIVLIWG